MNGDVRADEYWLDCEFCLEFDTGPIQTRTRAYEVGEGHAIEPREGPFALRCSSTTAGSRHGIAETTADIRT
jgi:hypothetical protein